MASRPNTKKFITLEQIKKDVLEINENATTHDIALSAIARCDHWKSRGYKQLLKDLDEATSL